MVPQPRQGCARIWRTIVALVFVGVFFFQQARAFQMSIQLEVDNGGRKIKTRVNPEYPELAVKAALSGTVRVELIVTPEGTVKQVNELGGSPVLLTALVRAVKQWKYEPAAKETTVEVKASFTR